MMRRKLRILHINLSAGGLGRYGALFGQALTEFNEIQVLSVINSALVKSNALKGIVRNVEKIELPFQTIRQKLEVVVTLRKVMREWQPDIIHDSAGSGCSYGLIVNAQLARKVPLFVTEHDPEPHSGMGTAWHSRLARRLVLQKSRHVFVHGPGGRNTMIRQGMNDQQVSTIHHGILSPLFNQNNANAIARETQTILFFGELRPNKGVHLLLPIADRIYADYPNVKFIVAGSSSVNRELRNSPWAIELDKVLTEMRQRPYFEVHDRFIPDDEVGLFFKRASITVLPYLDATQSGVAMIAMPMGSVVVATQVGDLPFVVQHGKTGYLAAPQWEEIAITLQALLADPQAMGAVRSQMQNWANRECSWETIVRKIVATYQGSVVASGRKVKSV